MPNVRLMSIPDLLGQRESWIAKDSEGHGHVVQIAEMDERHLRNLQGWLLDNAEKIKSSAATRLYSVGAMVSGEQASIDLDLDIGRLEEQDPQEWMREQPLFEEITARLMAECGPLSQCARQGHVDALDHGPRHMPETEAARQLLGPRLFDALRRLNQEEGHLVTRTWREEARHTLLYASQGAASLRTALEREDFTDVLLAVELQQIISQLTGLRNAILPASKERS